MNRFAIIAVAVLVLALAALGVVIGLNLLPSTEVAEQRGTLAPLMLTWGMIWITTLTAVVLAGFLLVAGMSTERRAV